MTAPPPSPPPHSDSGEESFRDVGHNDPDDKDDALQPAVAEGEADDEEGHSEHDCHRRDDVNEVADLSGDGRGWEGAGWG